MSGEPMCTVCEGAGWDWRRAADEQLQVDDPVVYYRCPCVKVMRLRAERDAERALADQLHHALCVSAVRLSYPEVFDALAAYRTARANGSASATDVGGPS